MASSESHEANINNIDVTQSDFNALVLRHKAMLWHICSDYNIGKAWKTEDCMQEVLVLRLINGNEVKTPKIIVK